MLALLVCSLLLAAPASGDATLFAKIEGFKITDGPTRFGPDNLFEAIDGGADTFLQFDFVELLSATYANAAKVEVTVDIYRHRDATRAFGIYSQERPAGTTAIPVGVEGYAGEDNLQLVTGPYYLKLVQAGTKAKPVLRDFADRIAAGLTGTKEPPAILKCFPARGKRPRAEKLSARDFLGQAFLHDGATAPYELDGGHFRLFAIEGKDEADAREMLRRYLAATKSPDAPKAEGSLTVKDPLNGQVDLMWKGRWIWGAVDEPSKSRKTLVEELGRNLAGLK
jgi:hypothetical protein